MVADTESSSSIDRLLARSHQECWTECHMVRGEQSRLPCKRKHHTAFLPQSAAASVPLRTLRPGVKAARVDAALQIERDGRLILRPDRVARPGHGAAEPSIADGAVLNRDQAKKILLGKPSPEKLVEALRSRGAEAEIRRGHSAEDETCTLILQ